MSVESKLINFDKFVLLLLENNDKTYTCLIDARYNRCLRVCKRSQILTVKKEVHVVVISAKKLRHIQRKKFQDFQIKIFSFWNDFNSSDHILSIMVIIN